MRTVMQALLIDDTATLADIDEALAHLAAIPTDQRGPAWHAYTDHILEQRSHTEGVKP